MVDEYSGDEDNTNKGDDQDYLDGVKVIYLCKKNDPVLLKKIKSEDRPKNKNLDK